MHPIKLPDLLPVRTVQYVNQKGFIDYWSSQYFYSREQLYIDNIKRPLTTTRLRNLFAWKNGRSLTRLKKKSVTKNYVTNRPVPPKKGNREDLLRFIQRPGGAIWRIFWLHCYRPNVYPIFDQHVHRAMRQLLEGEINELPPSQSRKAEIYVDEYLPFFSAFSYCSPRQLDRALWAYGKHLKQKATAEK